MPGEADTSWGELERVAAFSELHAADAAQALLRSEEIESFLTNAHLSGVAWPYAAVSGGIRLHVRPEDVARARELLDAVEADAADAAFEESVALDEACPSCGALNPEPFARPRRVMALLGTLLGGIGMPLRKLGLRCRTCGLEYFS